jgi:transposase-like protein
MFAKGVSVRDIYEHMDKIYGLELSPKGISNITDKVIAKA